MVYFASSGVAPAMTAAGPVSYQNPYYKTSCGCGSGNPQVTIGAQQPVRENFTPGMQMQAQQAARLQAPAGSMCTLTATAPPAGCCNPAPLHCDCCNGSGFFRAAEAYGS